MRFDIRPRGEGRTTDALAWMREAPEGEHRVLVCESAEQSMRVYRSTFDEDRNPTWAESWQFVSWRELFGPGVFSGVLRGRGGRVVLAIDDLDLILTNVLRFPVGLVTAADYKEEA